MTATLPPVLDVRVVGRPVAQARVKTRLFKNQHAPLGVSTSHYEPENSADWKRTIQGQVLPAKPPAPVEGALAMWLHFYLPRPNSLPKREVFHVKKPDLDNLAKAVKDALKGIVYRDDSQVVKFAAEKTYDPETGVWIRIERVVARPAFQQPELVAP